MDRWVQSFASFHLVCTKFDMIYPHETNKSPLKHDGWKTILSFGEGNFSGAMLNFRWILFLNKYILCTSQLVLVIIKIKSFLIEFHHKPRQSHTNHGV